jgi:hypothetical protein
MVALSQAGGRRHCRACLALLPPKLLEDPIKCIRWAQAAMRPLCMRLQGSC